jgi:hypothetical protein
VRRKIQNLQAKPSQAKPSQAKPSQAKPSQARRAKIIAAQHMRYKQDYLSATTYGDEILDF